MKSLKLTEQYTIHGLSKDEYTMADNLIEANNANDVTSKLLFKTMFDLDIDTLCGDTVIDPELRALSIPLKVANTIVETADINGRLVYRCYADNNWKRLFDGVAPIHENAHSSLNGVLMQLNNPYGILITKVTV